MNTMNIRQALQEKREEEVIVAFVNWLNTWDSRRWEIVERPNPPDAILRSGTTFTWIEHTNIFRNDEEARDQMSHRTPGEQPYTHPGQSIYLRDTFGEAFSDRLHCKLTLLSYEPVHRKFGRGILLLDERDPLFDARTLEDIRERAVAYAEWSPKGGLGFYSTVYLHYFNKDKWRFEFKKLVVFQEN